MAEAATKLVKPEMRRLLHSQIKRNLFITFVGCTIAGIGMKFLNSERHKKMYAEYYLNYDINKEFNRMRRKGVFSSCDPNDNDE